MLLYSVPSPVLLVVVLALSVGIVTYLQGEIHRRFEMTEFEQHNQVGGFIITIAGTLYAVVLGFITVVVWQNYQDAAQRVSYESAAIGDVWHTAVGFPAAERSQIRRDVYDYTKNMIYSEWPLMRAGRFSVEGDRIIMDMIGITGTYIPKNLAEANAQSSTMQALTTAHDARLRRLSSNQSGMSWLEWAVLGIGGFVVIGFCFLFGMRNNRTHTIMTSAVTVIIMTMIVMVFELQYPFRGDLGIQPTAWTGLMAHINFMDTQSPGNMRM